MMWRILKEINMNKYIVIAVAALSIVTGSIANAALITRTYSYTDGNTLSANENNTNENTIYNEFNGNIESANIKDATIATADIADSNITTAKIADANVTVAKLSTPLQSTMTWVSAIGSYRRPVLQWISITTIDVEPNTGTANETCIYFPNDRRCVTENTGSTSVNRRAIITEAASMSGTKNSGLRSGYVETANIWYSIYAAKVTDNTTDFVLVLDTVTPTQSNFSALNTQYGTNGWVYLGVVRNGDNSGATSDLLAFHQSGNMSLFFNALADANSGVTATGIRLVTSASAANITFTDVGGFSGVQIPDTVFIGLVGSGMNLGSAGTVTLQDSAAAFTYMRFPGTAIHYFVSTVYLPQSLKLTGTAASGLSIDLVGFYDKALGVGFNPQL